MHLVHGSLGVSRHRKHNVSFTFRLSIGSLVKLEGGHRSYSLEEALEITCSGLERHIEEVASCVVGRFTLCGSFATNVRPFSAALVTSSLVLRLAPRSFELELNLSLIHNGAIQGLGRVGGVLWMLIVHDAHPSRPPLVVRPEMEVLQLAVPLKEKFQVLRSRFECHVLEENFPRVRSRARARTPAMSVWRPISALLTTSLSKVIALAVALALALAALALALLRGVVQLQEELSPIDVHVEETVHGLGGQVRGPKDRCAHALGLALGIHPELQGLHALHVLLELPH
mmetsp:Transcript_26582/g.57736  ORF Transcript_26582/g.57736 Transcript_26582/m.57736 type:complete len:286 (-) Transcript_26582:91-948(-)